MEKNFTTQQDKIKGNQLYGRQSRGGPALGFYKDHQRIE